ncbi:MAG: hypothetical protein Q7R75_01605 [bacterium]|nr:hypothetical protein [bacterium]
MREFQEMRKLRRIFFSRPAFMVFCFIAILLVFSVFKVYKKSSQAVLKNAAVLKEIADINKRKSELEANLQKLKTEQGMEEELRKKFQIKRQGEEFFVIIEKEPPADNANNNNSQGKVILEKVLNFFKNIF